MGDEDEAVGVEDGEPVYEQVIDEPDEEQVVGKGRDQDPPEPDPRPNVPEGFVEPSN